MAAKLRPKFFPPNADSWVNGRQCNTPCKNESTRLEALHALGILDTPPELGLDELSALAAEIAISGVPRWP
jgi:hypothetical protein